MPQVDFSEGKFFSDQEWDSYYEQMGIANKIFDELVVKNGFKKTGPWHGCWPGCGIRSGNLFGKNINVHVSLEGERKDKIKPKEFSVTWSSEKTLFGQRVGFVGENCRKLRPEELNDKELMISVIEEALLKAKML